MRRPRATTRRPRPAAALALCLAGALALSACAGGGPQVAPDPTLPPASSSAAPADPGAPAAPAALPTGTPGEPEVVAGGLKTPWSVVPLADGGALVSERDTARVLRVGADGAVTPITATGQAGAVAGVTPRGEGGLLGLALAPGDDPLAGVVPLYAFTTTADDGRVVTMPLDLAAGTLGAPEPLVTGFPSQRIHHGGRIEFGPDGLLHIGVGDSGDTALSQDPGSLGGKILRVTADGTPAPGNPDPSSPVLSRGHRNVQGLGWDAAGRLFASEFGQDTFDELNLITAGGDYGWPDVEGFGGEAAASSGYTEPLTTWSPADASPSGLAVTGDAVYLAALRGEQLWRVPVSADGVVGQPESLYRGQLGRVRDVTVAADDGAGPSLFLVTDDDEDGELLRVRLT